MALVVTIAGTDRATSVETDSIRISQVADSFTFTAELSLFDTDSGIDITAGSHLEADEITIVDGATTYFGGYVVNQDIQAAEDDSRHLNLQCQGYGIRLNETLVEYEEYSNKADDWIINDLFDTYLAAFDSVTHVATIDAAIDISFTEMTLAECMEAICARTKGRWYIDNDKKVHYFAAESDDVAWFLSDTPEAATTNYTDDPALGKGDLTEWTLATNLTETRDTDHVKFGTHAMKLVPTGGGVSNFLYDGSHWRDEAEFRNGDATLSCWVYMPVGTDNTKVILRAYEDDGGGYVLLGSTTAPATFDQWIRLTLSVTVGGASVDVWFRFHYDTDDGAKPIWADGFQLEKKTAATSLCHGGRAGCSWNGVAHESTSDRIISYSYHNMPTKQIDAAAIVNRVRVIGADNFAVNRNDATSQAAYGVRAAIVTDQSLETTAQMEERGDEVLDKNKDPRIVYTARTYRDGAVAGQDIGFRCPALDVDTTQVIREMQIIWRMNEPTYQFTLGTHAETAAISRAFYTGDSIRSIIVSPNIPIASRGWSHDLVFSATDHDTVAWAAGTITMAGGVGSFAIAPGDDTGNMAATTYIYFDADVSLTALQTDTSAANTVGANKILIAVAKNVAAGKKAIYQVFGGEGTGVLVDTDAIAVGAVDTTEIAALAVEAANIGAQAVETGKLALKAVETAQLGDGAVTAVQILGNTITAGEIAAGTITAAEILANTITAGEIAAGTITAAEILANTITAGEIAANTIESGNIKANTIEAGDIKANTITAGEIAAATITTNEILANTILAGDIAANTLTANEIAGNTITAAEIAAATITATEIVAATITADKLSIGQTLFSNADGLLILNPPIRIEKPDATNYWHTLRGQKATLSGALHLEQGRWAGTKALVVEKAATNLIENTLMYDGDDNGRADGWTVFDNLGSGGSPTLTTVAHEDGWLQRVQYTGAAGDVDDAILVYARSPAASFAPADDVTVQFVCKGSSSGVTVHLHIQAENNVNASLGNWYSDAITLTQTLQRITLLRENLPANTDHVRVAFYVLAVDNGDTLDAYFGKVQAENSDYATTHCHGNKGDGYAWTGDEHDSTSTRAATEINLDDHVGLLASNNTMSFRIVAQMPHDHDATWQSGNTNYLFDLRKDAATRIYMEYDPGNEFWDVFINGSSRMTAAATFSAGDWVDIVLTVDFGNDSYALYIDGAEADTGTTSLATAAYDQWNIGSNFAALLQGGFAFAEFAVFDRVLTATEVAQLYNLQRPLIDTGATDKPGIYILDGQFRIQSSQTGVRIEITPEMIAGYDGDGTKQFYLQASDGKAYAGGGAVILDDGGVNIAVTASEGATRAYKFSLSDVNIGGLYGLATAAGGWLRLYAIERAAKTSNIDIQAIAPTTYAAQTFIRAKSGATDVQLTIKADSDAGTPGYGMLTGATYMDFNSDVYATTYSTDNGTTKWKLKGVHGGTYVGWVGYVEVEINGTTYKLTHGTWT